MAWKNAGIVFRGGTQEAKSLTGKRARARRSLVMPIYINDPELKGDPGELAIAALAEGVIGYVPIDKQDEIVIAFSATPGVKLTSLTQIGRISITSVHVNWPTFRAFFDIDA